jgi:hypothetical protein
MVLYNLDEHPAIAQLSRHACLWPRRPDWMSHHPDILSAMTRSRGNRRSQNGSLAPVSSASATAMDGAGPEVDWSRAGARTVAGITYQLAVTAYLVVAGRCRQLPLIAVMPEGHEDIDCEMADGSLLMVQAKERLAGAGCLTVGEVATAVRHALPRLIGDPAARLAIVTDAAPGQGVAVTGWDTALASCLSGRELEVLAKAVDIMPPHIARVVFGRVHLVRLGWDVASWSARLLGDCFDLVPAVAGLVRASLFEDLAAVTSDQRFRDPSNATRRRVSDLDTMVQRVLETVDLSQLDLAVREGIVEWLDFTCPDRMPVERFLAGVDVHPGHVAAQLDLPRPGVLEQVYAGLHRDRYVMLVGTSGSGKSALLWRAAYDVAGVVRPFRIRRVEPADVPTLVRWVRLQRPSPRAPVLVCADDLGRAHMSGWEDTAGQLLEIPGVLMVAAARQEDFHPGMARGRATIVEPKLDSAFAAAITAALQGHGIKTWLDAGEAFQRSAGLLMEFLSLLLAGRRLEQVVAAQVAERLSPERRTEREVLRYVCTSHALGLSIGAGQLRVLVGDPPDLHQALRRLQDEHLITTDEQTRWVGLHELRSTVIARCLHDLPPPTELDIIVNLLRHVGSRARPHLITRYASASTIDLTRLADAVGDLIGTGEAGAAAVGELVDALGEADAIRHAQRCLAATREVADMLHIDRYTLLHLAYRTRHGLADAPNQLFAMVADALPDWPASLRERAATALSDARVVELATSAPSENAVRLLEALDGVFALTPQVAQDVWHHHMMAPLDVRARLLAALASLTSLPRGTADQCFGLIGTRLQQAADEQADVVGWDRTHDPDHGVTVTVQMLAPPAGNDPHVAVSACARTIFDLGPDVDAVRVVLLDPDGVLHRCRRCEGQEPIHGVITRAECPRTVAMQPHAAFLDAAIRLLADRYWTDRLRQQAHIAESLIRLFDETPKRLLDRYDKPHRRRAWARRIESIRGEIGTLPPPPVPDLDHDTYDPAKMAFQNLAMGLRMVGEHLETNEKASPQERRGPSGLVGPFRWSIPYLRQARALGYPRLASIGDALPEALDNASLTLAELLLARADQRPHSPPAIRQAGQQWADVATAIIDEVRTTTLAAERSILENLFAHIDNASLRCARQVHLDTDQVVTDAWFVLLPAGLFVQGRHLLQALPGQQRKLLASRVYVLPTHEGQVVPITGARLDTNQLHPLDRGSILTLSQEQRLPVLSEPVTDLVDQILNKLLEASRNVTAAHLRSPKLRTDVHARLIADALANAEQLLMNLDDEALRRHCHALMRSVQMQMKVDGGKPGLAATLARTARDGLPNDVTVAEELTLATVGALGGVDA